MKFSAPTPRVAYDRPRLLIVGAFQTRGKAAVGGIATSCRVLLQSSLPQRADLTLVDSTQISNPPPGFAVRLLLAIRRCARYIVKFEGSRPNAVLLFTAMGASGIEKGVMAWYARLRGARSLLLPRCHPPANRLPLWCQQVLNGVCYGGAHQILCQGTAWQSFAIDVLGMSHDDAPVVRNWTATPELLAIGRERTARSEGAPVRLLFLGWLEREKGIFELIEACLGLPETASFELDIVGDGRAMPKVRRAVDQSPLGDKVHFHGWLRDVEKNAALMRADVLVLPSWSEGLPNAMIEAMAAGLAIVVTSVGNIPDAVVEGKEALFVPPKDVTALRAALARVVSDADLRSTLGKAALTAAEQRFGAERAVDSILAATRGARSPLRSER